jgi:hypothetical protein
MNENETALVTTEQDISLMQRADVPAVWEDFRSKLERLKITAETLTVTDVSQVDEMKLARATRLTLKNLRVEIETKRRELGEEALRRKQNIDSQAKDLKNLIEPLEQRLLEQEQFVERKEAARKTALKETRTLELLPFVTDTGLYNLADMSDAAYSDLLTGSKAAHESKIQAEKKAEEERVAKEKADAEERERMRQENVRLKKEAEELEAVAKKEREAAAAEQSRLKKQVEDERKASEAIERKEREARQKIERELADKKAAEEKAIAEKLAAEKKAAAAPDKKKLVKLAVDVRAFPLPVLLNDSVSSSIQRQFVSLSEWIEKQCENL